MIKKIVFTLLATALLTTFQLTFVSIGVSNNWPEFIATLPLRISFLVGVLIMLNHDWKHFKVNRIFLIGLTLVGSPILSWLSVRLFGEELIPNLLTLSQHENLKGFSITLALFYLVGICNLLIFWRRGRVAIIAPGNMLEAMVSVCVSSGNAIAFTLLLSEGSLYGLWWLVVIALFFTNYGAWFAIDQKLNHQPA